MKQVAETGEPLMLTEHGKPAVMVTLPREEPKKRIVMGQFSDQFQITGDIVSPLDEPWKALE